MIQSRTRWAVALALTLAASTRALAAPPQLTGVSPLGVQRGASTALTFNGTNLAGNPRLVAPFGFVVGTPAPAGSDAANAKFTMTVDAATPVGVYPVRVQTDDGVSNPFLFAVGQLAQVAEKEENGTFAVAQVVAAPVVIEGQVAGNDVDAFRFAGKKGQRVVVNAQCRQRIGSTVDPSIKLSTAAHAFVASAEDSPGLFTDARLFAVLPEDADYVVEISDARYQGGARPVYRLILGEVPAAEEVYPMGGRAGETVGLELRGGTLDGVKLAAARLEASGGVPLGRFRASAVPGGLDMESMPPLVVGDAPEVREPSDPNAPPVKALAPVAFNGRIDPSGDEDRFTLAVSPGQALRIEVEASDRGSGLDGVLRVLDAKGAQLAQADDTPSPTNPKPAAGAKPTGTSSPDPSLDFTVPAGQTEVTLALTDLASRGGVGYPYRIKVTPVGSGFSATLNDSQVSVPKGGTVAVGATVVRKGYAGPIALKVANPPPGLSFRAGTIPDGQTVGVLTLSAAPDAAFGVVNLDVVAEPKAGDPSAAVHMGKSTVFAVQATLPTNSITQIGLTTAPALPLSVSLDTPADPIEVAHGYGTAVPVKVVRVKDAPGPLAFTAAAAVATGLAVAPANVGEKDAQGSVTVNTSTDVPLGLVSVAFLAKGKVGGVDLAIISPGVTLNVVKPAGFELATAAIDVKAGTTAEVKGKVSRKGAFKEPVTVKASGLPAGLKVDPVIVPPDASEFTLKLVAEPSAPPATAAASIALAFQVNKKDYPPTPAPLTVKVLPAK